ncbi:MAG: (deoxy)nucleoside triphosphate pyrophosphohydrolase [Cyclobacteriaceae bacterium]
MIRVVCAIITRKSEVLCVRRSAEMSQPLLWEFPGGKIMEGETEQQALVREIMEELNLKVKPEMRLKPVTHQYEDKKIELIPYFCKADNANPILTEHADYCWLKAEKLTDLEFCSPDVAIAEQVNRWISV